ncbi:MAG TPA: DegT/DnrJ/EryC1/StrS family aminotransferase [Gaiellaceae bacterium]|jgi:dTDP-4-amino-4,6-dideoxygalactose transaminase|nr:DegT/DnrJ/EryC1/StrS family aminotransferase [Gaiellaceae bacterium]
MAIPHADVHAQYAPLIPELKEAFARTLDSGRFIFGPEVEAFEREAAEKLGVLETVSCANGTDAIVLVLDAMEIGPGDEVICPAFTFYATAEAIARRGATPVFAEIDPATLNLDPTDVERRITERTKAIMPVHLFGRPAPDLSGFGIPVIEDAAQAFGAPGIATSIASTFSFFPSKNLFALGDGGLIAVNDADLAKRLRMLRFHGSESKKEFLYVGYNSRLDAMQASFLRIFLRHIDDWNAQRREAAARYRDLLDGFVETPEDVNGHIYHQFCIRSPERDKLAAALKEADIQSAIFYSPPLHLQPALRYLGYAEGDFPETERASREDLCLPMWAGISEEQQAEVVAVLKRSSELVRS